MEGTEKALMNSIVNRIKRLELLVKIASENKKAQVG